MYKPPIEIFQTSMETMIERIQKDTNDRMEGMICKACQDVGVYVDKEELIKAINYERNQYEKGYEDGKRESVVHAHWDDITIRIGDTDEDGKMLEPNCWDEESLFQCSNCGAKRKMDGMALCINTPEDISPFCSQCGAKMDEEV